MPTLNHVRRVLEQRVATEFVGVVPVYFGNIQVKPPNNTAWVWFAINFGDASYESLDGLDWVNGVAQANIFTPVASGHGLALTLGDRLKGLFNRVQVSGVYFRPANGPRAVAQEPTSAWAQMSVSVQFVAEEYQP